MTEQRLREVRSVTVLRYTIFQVPAALALAAVLWVAVDEAWATKESASVIFALWILKDTLLYPVLRKAYERPEEVAAKLWNGRIGRAEEDLAPFGYVRVMGERWHAEALASDIPIRAGEQVRVESVDGLQLRVRRAHGDETVRST